MRDKACLKILKCSSLGDRILKLYDAGLPPGSSTGWVTLDPYYTVQPGQWTLITGVPSHGKSTWVDCLTANMAYKDHWRFVMFSPEQQPPEMHMSLIAEKIMRKPFRKNFNGCMGKPELAQAVKFIDKHYQFLVQDPEFMMIPTLLDVIEYASMAIENWRDEGIDGPFGVVIDPWTELSHELQADSSETTYIREMLTMLRMYANSLNIHIFLIAHPKQLIKNPKTGEYPIPSPYDISGSAHWHNKADNCITVWRQEEGNVVEIHIKKVRFRHIGKRGIVPLLFDIGTGTYSDLSTGGKIFCGPTHLAHSSTDDF